MSTVDFADRATGYVRRMYESEVRGWGDHEGAMTRLEAKTGIPFWSLEHLRRGKAKSVESGLYQRIRAAYLHLCERQVATLQHEIAIERALSEDAALEDLEREAVALARKIEAKKAALKG